MIYRFKKGANYVNQKSRQKSLYNLTTNKGLWIRHKNKGVAVIAEGLGELGNYKRKQAIKIRSNLFGVSNKQITYTNGKFSA